MLHQLESVHGRTCRLNDKSYLFFSGYDYLAMQAQPEFKRHIKEGIDKYGWLHPSSRISNTQLILYQQLEEALSVLTGLEHTVTFSSGYLAAQAVSKALSGYKTVYKAPGTHPALSFAHKLSAEENFKGWSSDVVSVINKNPPGEVIVVCFGAINIFKPTINDASFLEDINPDQKLIVVIDDSHGIGVIGENGKGISSYVPQKQNIEYIIIYSLSKAFNISGGAVSCSKLFANTLRGSTCYSASTALSPAMAYAFLQSKELYAMQLQTLKNNIKYFLTHINKNLLTHPALPIVVLDEPGIEEELFKNEIIISSFNYPLPSSEKIHRIVFNAAHTKEDIDVLLTALV